jgi:hypothetical protein
VKGSILMAGTGTYDDVQLEESVEDVDVSRQQVGLGKGMELSDLRLDISQVSNHPLAM